MRFRSAAELFSLCRDEGCTVAEAMLRRETERSGVSEEAVRIRLKATLDTMRNSAREAVLSPRPTLGGLIGGEAKRLRDQQAEGRNICGPVVSAAVAYSMGVLEVNASMGLIVAAPTAGASGVLPGVLLALAEEYRLPEKTLVDGLLTAGAVGLLADTLAFVSGAAGGCQAEIGVASSMAAAAAVILMGGSDEAAFSAASTAMQNLLGLVCDPVAGLVEIPCQTRNAVGAANALVSAEIALAGIPARIPLDETLEAMKSVGCALPDSLRETGRGGIAAAPSARRLAKLLRAETGGDR